MSDNKSSPNTSKSFTPEDWAPATQLVHGGTMRSQFCETSEAMFLTQGYVYDNAEQAEERFKSEAGGYIYSRYANPTLSMFEERMRVFEGAEAARATASGMAAVTGAILSYLKAGDHVVSARALFGSCRYVVEDLCPRFGIQSTMVHGPDLEAWKAAIRPQTKVLFFETPANPTLDLVDIAAVAKLAHDHGAIVIVDNVFATPMLQRPLTLGADVVVYSATKHIDGQGRCLGGIVLGSRSFVDDHLHPFLKHTGPSLSPFNAWVMLKGLETLPARMRAHCDNAMAVARWLEGRPGVRRVLYPGLASHPQHALAARQQSGFGGIVSFELEGGREAAWRFVDATEMVSVTANLGDVRTTLTHPASTTHGRLSPEARAEAGIGEGLLRVAVGLEDVEDILADLERGLEAARRA